MDVTSIACSSSPTRRWSGTRLPSFRAQASITGHDGVRQAIADMLDAFGDLRAESQRFIDADDRVVALYRWRGRGSASGITVDDFEVPVGVIATMNADGRAIDVRFYITWEKALEIAGVE